MGSKFAYKVMYEIVPVMCSDGCTFPELQIKFRRRGEIFLASHTVFDKYRFPGERKDRYKYAIKDDFVEPEPWVEIPQQPIDLLARRMYPQFYDRRSLDNMNRHRRIFIFNKIIRGYFGNQIEEYVKAVVRDFILTRRASFDGNKSAAFTARRWYTKCATFCDICATFPDSAVRDARNGKPDFRRILLKEGAVDFRTHKLLDVQDKLDYTTYKQSKEDNAEAREEEEEEDD